MSTNNQGNQQYKDGIFRYIFKEEKNFIDLYLELTGEKLNVDDIKFYDMSSLVVSKNLKNDISFITTDNRFIIMVEHQSTVNENMALRSLLYYAELLKVYIAERGLNLFGSRKIEFPKAELYVVYNGERNWAQNDLSIIAGDIKVTVELRDINYNNLRHTDEQNSLAGYAYLVELVRQYQHSGCALVQALEQAKHVCLDKGYLVDYLSRKEFLTMLQKEYTIEDQIRDEREYAREEGREEGIEQGREQGREEGREQGREQGIEYIIAKMLSKGFSPEEIASITDNTIEEIRDILGNHISKSSPQSVDF